MLKRNIENVYTLSPMQQGLLFHGLLAPDSEVYCPQICLEIGGELNCMALETAFQEMVNRHSILRTGFLWQKVKEPKQVVYSSVKLPFSHYNWKGKKAEVQHKELEKFLAADRAQGFELDKAPLMRCSLIQFSDNIYQLIWSQHHLLMDGWSVPIFFRELFELYDSYCTGRESRLEYSPPYQSFIAWVMEQDKESAEQFWRRKLEGFKMPTPIGLRGGSGKFHDPDRKYEEHSIQLSTEVTQQHQTFVREHNLTMNILVQGAWALLLGCYSDEDDVIFGTVVSGRHAEVPGIETMIGLFINTLPLRVRITRDDSVITWLQKLHRDNFERDQYSYCSLTDIQKWSEVTQSMPLFESLMAFENYPINSKPVKNSHRDWSKKVKRIQIQKVKTFERSNYPLTFTASSGKNTFFNFCYDPTRFDKKLIARMMKHLQTLLGGMVSNPGQQISEISILSEEESHQLLIEWNETDAEYSKDKCINELFEKQVEITPDIVAVVFENEQISYRELNRRANQLAHYLVELGVKPDSLVAIGVERSIEMVMGILSILKAGGAYVPLDPGYPIDRLSYIIKDSAPMALLTHSSLKDRWCDLPESIPVIEVDSDTLLWEGCSSSNPKNLGFTSDCLAYVIYTSGSTGTPKGVMVEHGNVVRLFSTTEEWYHFAANDIWTLFHSYAFDFSVWEIWGALLYGGRLVVVGQILSRSPEEFYQLLCQQEVTILNQTPSAFRQVIDAQAGSMQSHVLRKVIFGGEALEVGILKPWFERNDTKETQLINMYGITETTVHVTYHPLDPIDTKYYVDSPIGSRIPDLYIYILDANGKPVPIGVAGELYIGGAGVARGYLNMPDLTVERFMPDPFTKKPDARMYKTGDLGKWVPDGTIEFLGRNDFQVKIRGFRIELGEIESRLSEVEGVKEVVVLAREDIPGEKRLIAYYTVRETSEEITAEDMRSSLANQVPEYMLPSAYMALEEIPLTPNGKIDHKALPAPDDDAYSRGVYEAPVGKVEEALSRIWSELLNVEQVGRHDNFFELGGHSLLAVQLIERLRRNGLKTDVQSLFTSSTLKDLAVIIGKDETSEEVPPNLILPDCDSLTPDLLPLVTLEQGDIDQIIRATPGGVANIQDIYPLAPLQEGIFFHYLMGGESDPYVVLSLWAFECRELLDGFLTAFQSIIDRHDILRTAVLWEDLPEPVQVVWRKATLPIEEVLLDPSAGDAADQMRERFSRGNFRMDIRKAPMMHTFIARDDRDGRWLFAWLSHHLIDDNTTMKIFSQELDAYLAGEESSLPAALPFRNYVAQTRLGVSHEEHEAFFREMLSDVEEPTAPYGLLDVRGDGSDIEEARLEVNMLLCLRLREHARLLGVGAASMFHLAWARVLACLCGSDDVVFGTVLFGRMQGGEGADRVMGMFINTLPVRIDVKDDGVEETIKKTHRMLAELLKHEHASLALAQRCSGVVSPMPLFTSLLNYRHIQPMSSPFKEANAPRRGMQLLFSEERTNYPLALSVNDLGEGYSLTAQVQRPIDPYQVCRYMNTALEHIADALENEPLMAVGSVDVLSEAELHQLLYEWNNTAVEYPKDKCIHKLFEDQATRTPDAIAVIFENDHISYRELNRRTNQLGHYLRSLGVSPDVPVGIYLDKSLEMIIGILGALKAGGAYVPLDPEYPEERLAFILVDSNISVLLSMERLATLFSEAADKESFLRRPILLCLDTDWKNIAKESEDASVVVASSQNSAYILYTSGSTGKPKGVIGYHQGLCNLASDQYRRLDVKPDSRILQFASLNFDASTWEIILALCSGATLCMAQKDLLLPGATLEKLMNKLIITHVLLPPSALALMHPKEMETVNAMVVGGEACSNELACFWYDKLRFFNAYGPTESTVIATMVEYSNIVSKFSIGRAINNTKIYILDPQIHPVLLKVSGELHIGGDGLSYGYLNQMELTAEKFIPEPFGNRPGSRLYKTGDLARYLEDGNIEFIGRIDDQVKIRGFRIELGEIESDILEYSGVKEVVILAREDRPGDKRLVAYIVSSHGELPDAVEIRNYLKTKLPDYMIPSAFVMLDEMPLTPNGKIDRKALPAPEGSGLEKEYVAPRTENEKQLAEIWSEVLGVERVGIYDNFFELGGHSLLAITLVEHMRREGFNTDIQILFTCSNLKDLADIIENNPESLNIYNPPRYDLNQFEKKIKLSNKIENANKVEGKI